MKVNGVDVKRNTYYQTPIIRGKKPVAATQNRQDEVVMPNKKQNNRSVLVLCGLAMAGIGAFLAHKEGLFTRFKDNVITGGETKLNNINQAKEYFEKLGIDTIFKDVTEEHLPMLNRIKRDIAKLTELDTKFKKPDSITISDWKKVSEYEELCRKRGVSVERRENYHAFCSGDSEGRSHIFINASHPQTDVFRHEMGHANHHRGHDSFWEAKGIKQHDFADKQLEILGEDMKIYRGAGNFYNIFHFNPDESQRKFAIPNQDLETRFVYIKGILNKMQEETNCYAPESISEQVAYIFDGLVRGKKYSDEVMLYYDFSGGARIPNLKIEGKNYDEYIETLYNNAELIQKMKDNIIISKI